MPKAKKNGQKTSRRITGKVDEPAVGAALQVIDQRPFLKKALSTCRRLRKELHAKQALLADFEEHDRVAYQQWFSGTFGAHLSGIREQEATISAYGFIKHQLEYITYWHYEALPEVYEELMRRKKEGTLYEYEPTDYNKRNAGDGDDEDAEDDDEDDDEDWDEACDDDRFGDEADEDFKKFFDDMFGGRSGHRESQGFGAKLPPEDAARLKACYRGLAKRLHPDHSELEESLRDKRWHEIQEAYHQGDLEALLRVEAVCDMDDTGLSLELGLAKLRDLAAYHQSHLQPIRMGLRKAKQDIAFGFAKKGPTAQMERGARTELEYKSHRLAEMVEGMAEYLECLYEDARDFFGEEKARAMAEAEAALAEAEAARAEATKAREESERERRQRGGRNGDARQMSFF